MSAARWAVAATGGGAAAAAVLIALVVATTGIRPAPAAAAPASIASPAATSGLLYAGGYQDPARGAESASHADLVPTRLRIPAIGVDAGLERLAIGADGRLAAPVDDDEAGWFAAGVVPGDVGPAIVAGHVDSATSAAVFYRIAELQPGDVVQIDRSDGSTAVFTVTGTEQSPKADFPTSDVYSIQPTAELRLVTCAGAFDAALGHYTDNLIVFATRTG